MVWQPELDEMEQRRAFALQMGGEANIERQHAGGKLTVRERIERLLDPGSFHEIGMLAGVAEYAEDGTLINVRPSNFVMGTGRIGGRRVVVGGDDFTVRGGAADASIGGKQAYAEKMARELRLPMIRLVDGTGGGGSVRTLIASGRTYIPANPGWETIVASLSEIPVIAAALGSVAGLGAARVVTSHFSVMVKGTSQLFVAGPPVVEAAFGTPVTKEELGGSHIHTHGSMAVDNEVESEEEAFAQIRRFLSYLPQNVWQMPPYAEPCDDPNRREEELLSLVPRNRRRPYDARKMINLIVDRDSFFEIGRYHGRSQITGLARLAGYPVAVLANDPLVYGGGMDAAAAEKLERFVDLADTFHLPVVNFVDQPGFVIGVAAEKAGTIRKGAAAMAAVYQATVPWATVMVRRAYGVAGAAQQNHSRYNLRVAWPSGDWGSLPIEGGLEAAYRRDLENAADPAALRAELERRLNAVRSPFRVAEVFGIEEIIDPRETRAILCDWVPLAYEIEATRLGPKTRGARC
jgi:acetyl-CoA carboxylase carboxyltransferase component